MNGDPKFTHSCSGCVFLGHYEKHDLYFCDQHSISGPTVVARYGHAGPDYSSGLWIARSLSRFNDLDPMVEALRRAQARGLVE